MVNEDLILRMMGTLFLMQALAGCSTMDSLSDLAVDGEKSLRIPVVEGLEHPQVTTMVELKGFVVRQQEKIDEFYPQCDPLLQPFLGGDPAAQVSGEKAYGLQQLVQDKPEILHWCFYQKLYLLEMFLNKDNPLQAMQETFLTSLELLTPIARSFLDIYKEPRYLRWTTHMFQSYGFSVFYQKTEITPQGFADLMMAPKK